MSLSRSRLNKVLENIEKAKQELSQLNTKIEEVKDSIQVKKFLFFLNLIF